MNVSLKSFLLKLVFLVLLLGAIHFFVVKLVLDGLDFFYPIFANYLFLFVLTSVIYGLVVYVNKHFSEYTGYTFMGGGLVKMFVSILYLLPLMLSDSKALKEELILFFLAYFSFLIFETIYVSKLLNSKM